MGANTLVDTLSGLKGFSCAGSGIVTGFDAIGKPICIEYETVFPPIKIAFSASPNPTGGIKSGEKVTLTWSADNAASCTASGGGWTGLKGTSGTEAVYPTSTTTYKMNCKNDR